MPQPEDRGRRDEAVAEALDRRSRDRGRVVKRARVRQALASFDEGAAKARVSAQVRYEIWDGSRSPVGSMADDEFRAHLRRRLGWDGEGSVLLGYDGGRLVVIQPTAPGGNSPMTVAEAVELGAEMAGQAVAGRVFGEAVAHAQGELAGDDEAWEDAPTVSPAARGGVRGETSADPEEA